MFKKFLFICLWITLLSGTASTGSIPAHVAAPAVVHAATR